MARPKKTPALPAPTGPEFLAALVNDPTTGEPWVEGTAGWHEYVAAGFDAAAKLLGVAYFTGCADGHRIAAKYLRENPVVPS